MKFTITAGHDPVKTGAAYFGHKEHELMTWLRDAVADILRDRGHQVKTDGARWQNLPLVHAITLVPGADVAIELHTNAFESPKAAGVEVVSMPAQKEVARTIARRIAHTLEIPVRGAGGWIDQSDTARGRLGFVRAGGLVVETFFLSNRSELDKYLDRKHLVAAAIAESLAPTVWSAS